MNPNDRIGLNKNQNLSRISIQNKFLSITHFYCIVLVDSPVEVILYPQIVVSDLPVILSFIFYVFSIYCLCIFYFVSKIEIK